MPINNAFTRWLARKVDRRMLRVSAKRKPDFVIGGRDDPYLERWWILPRNRFANVYLHVFWRDDIDRALHDHPFPSLSLTLYGDMREVYLERQNTHDGSIAIERTRQVKSGTLIYRSAKFAHRMIVDRPGSMTLFITGPRIREWGFHCPKGWVHWKQFVDDRDKGTVGRGCD